MNQPSIASSLQTAASTKHYATRVWDLPTRLFHWALAFCVICLLITGFLGGNAMPWHFRFGYCVLTLLLFRLVWGFVGGTWSRFSSFIYAPKHVINYLKGRRDPLHEVGHNPLGSLSVFAMLAFLLVQVATGLISDDEISAAGPLTRFVANATVQQASNYHINIGKFILIVLVVTHLLAIVFYLVKKSQNLIKPMLHGDKELPLEVLASRDTTNSRFMALLILAICATAVYGLVNLGG
jgi:cytochrome b